MTGASLRRGYADTPLGQIHYVEQGSGPAILLLHQAPRSGDEFRELVPLLAGNARVIAMDMPGFGMSYSVSPLLTIEAMAHGGFALLDALDIPSAAVLGHHTGGVVAIEMAAEAPIRVDALIASSTPWVDKEFRSAHVNGRGVDEAIENDHGSHLTVLWSKRRPYYPDFRPDLLDRFIRDALAPGVNPTEGHLACARYEMERRIGLVTAPTLVIGASDDPFSLPDFERIQKHLTAAETVESSIVQGGMIPLMEHKAAAVADVVNEFLMRPKKVRFVERTPCLASTESALQTRAPDATDSEGLNE